MRKKAEPMRQFSSWVAAEIYRHAIFGAAGEALRLLDRVARTPDGVQRDPTLDEVRAACESANYSVHVYT